MNDETRNSGATPQYRRILLKLSGEALMGQLTGGIDPAITVRIAGEINEVHATGCEVGVVIGGGNMVRGEAVAAHGGDRVTGDHMGMLATIINGLSLKMALRHSKTPVHLLSSIPIPGICETFTHTRARELMKHGTVVIFAGGTGNPYFTTDAGAALKAIEMQCDILLKATKVDGVYSQDPITHADAERYDRLRYDDVMTRGLKVMDSTAIALAQENRLPVGVFSLLEKGAITDAVFGRARMTLITA